MGTKTLHISKNGWRVDGDGGGRSGSADLTEQPSAITDLVNVERMCGGTDPDAYYEVIVSME